MLNWTWNIEHFSYTFYLDRLSHCEKTDKKRCDLNLQGTVALSSKRASIYQTFLQCSQGLSGVVSQPAVLLLVRAGALQLEPAPAMGAARRGQWAPGVQQGLHNSTRHTPGSGAAARIRWQKEAARFSVTPLSTGWDCSIKSVQFAVNNNANFYLCFRTRKRETWGKDSFSLHVMFVLLVT